MIGSAGILLVLDQGVPRDVAILLRKRGQECIHVGEIGMSMAGDEEIIAWSLERGAIIVTLDADFHAILAVSRACAPSVIRIRMQGLGALAVVDLIQAVFGVFALELLDGSLVTEPDIGPASTGRNPGSIAMDHQALLRHLVLLAALGRNNPPFR